VRSVGAVPEQVVKSLLYLYGQREQTSMVVEFDESKDECPYCEYVRRYVRTKEDGGAFVCREKDENMRRIDFKTVPFIGSVVLVCVPCSPKDADAVMRELDN
jgi:hypothetical protein